jgi:hypothetical protein
MTITATFATGIPVTVEAWDYQVDEIVETFFEQGAIIVTTKEN